MSDFAMLDYATNPIIETNAQGQPIHILESLKLQYNGERYLYTKHIPDLVTKLNFNGNLTYNDYILGMDNMKINVNGNLVYGGVLRGYGGGNLGNILVNGAANVEGSTAAATNILPGETMTILTANSVTGNLKNSSTYAPISGLLSAK